MCIRHFIVHVPGCKICKQHINSSPHSCTFLHNPVRHWWVQILLYIGIQILLLCPHNIGLWNSCDHLQYIRQCLCGGEICQQICQPLNTVHSPVLQWNTVTLTFTCSSVFLQFEALKTITPVCPNLIDTHMCAFPIKYCTI